MGQRRINPDFNILEPPHPHLNPKFNPPLNRELNKNYSHKHFADPDVNPRFIRPLTEDHRFYKEYYPDYDYDFDAAHNDRGYGWVIPNHTSYLYFLSLAYLLLGKQKSVRNYQCSLNQEGRVSGCNALQWADFMM